MKNYAREVRRVGVGGTRQLCQDAMIEMLEELFAGKKFNSQEGKKELKIVKQNLPIPKRQRDKKADTDEAAAPYIVVEMNEGAIPDDDGPQIVEFSLVICAYDKGTDREGYQDVTNIKEDIIQRVCARPYFGGVFTVLKPITWALQQDNTPPYYFGAVTLIVRRRIMAEDNGAIKDEKKRKKTARKKKRHSRCERAAKNGGELYADTERSQRTGAG